MFLATALLTLAVTGPTKPPLDNVSWGQKQPIKLKYKQEKMDEPNAQGWSANIGGEDVLILAHFTPISRKLWSVAYVYGVSSNFSDGVSRYQDFRQALINKYGNPSDSYDFFHHPYEQGDGYEDTALQAGKYTLSDYWLHFTTTLVSLSLTKSGYTRVSYQNPALSDVEEAESLKIKENSL